MSHPRNYFKQLNYIEGTYIRKDRFNESINIIPYEYIRPIERIPDEAVEDWLCWRAYERLLSRSLGIPPTYFGK